MGAFSIWLRRRIDEGKLKNPQFSLRAYAKAVSVSPATLSKIINGKSEVTLEVAKKIAQWEGFDTEERQNFFDSLTECDSSSEESFRTIDLDRYCVISEWQHGAILSLAQLKRNSASVHWIAKRLGITVVLAKNSLERLIRLDLVRVDGRRLVATHRNIATTTDVPSTAIRKTHQDVLQKSIESLHCVPVDKRDITTAFLPVDRSQLPELKAEIQKFRRKINQKYASGEANEVYALNVSLIPLTEVTQ